jgi:hypothetical protein
MQEIITLHCGIATCNTHYTYYYDEKNITAIRAQWRNEASKNGDWSGLLPEQPNVGETYEIAIQFALQIDLRQDFWVTYFEPYTEHEGLESEAGIDSLLFCLCRKKNVIAVTRHMAKVKVEVLDVRKAGDDLAQAETNKRKKTFRQRNKLFLCLGREF